MTEMFDKPREYITEWFEDEEFVQQIIAEGLAYFMAKGSKNTAGITSYIMDKRNLEDGKLIAGLVCKNNGVFK